MARLAILSAPCSLALALALAIPASAAAETPADSGPSCASACGGAGFDTGRIGIGGAVGHEWQVDQRDGDQISLLGQFRLTRALTLEVELGRTEYDDSNDEDRRLGGAVSYQVGKLAFLSPFIVAGTGSIGETRDTYLEAGGGIKFPITRNVVIMLDVRSGQRWGQDEPQLSSGAVANVVGEPGPVVDPGSVGNVKYSRWRLVGMAFF